VDRWAASSGSACDSETINDNTTIYGTIATVTVTWEGMGASTKPHTASQIFPPKRNETLALDPGQALLVVEVQGAADAAGNTLKEGVRVELSGTGGDPIAKVTNAKGCVAFEVTPTAGGANDYVATLLGDGSNNWITPGGEKQPTVEFLDVKAGDSYVQTAPPYERAARLEVSVTGSVDSVSAVHLRPRSGDLTAAHQEPLDEGTNKAIFTDVYPGEYEVYAGTSPLVDVTLAAGEFKQANVEVPL
jgi:hypothetical protein